MIARAGACSCVRLRVCHNQYQAYIETVGRIQPLFDILQAYLRFLIISVIRKFGYLRK